VKVNVFGEFPSSSLNSLIGIEEMQASMKRYYREFEIGSAPKILGVDVARDGGDASVIARRQGIQAFKVAKHRNIDSTQGAGHVSREWSEWGADACFIDMTGGFGSGWYDQLAVMGRTAIGVQFSQSATNPARYFNKRAEMYFDFAEWIKRGGALPESPEITAAMTQTHYSFKGDKLILEPKEAIKAKLGYSPDEADAFALTFAHPVTPLNIMPRRTNNIARSDFNPYGSDDAEVARMYR